MNNTQIDYQDAITWPKNTMETFYDEPQWRLDNLQRLIETLTALDMIAKCRAATGVDGVPVKEVTVLR